MKRLGMAVGFAAWAWAASAWAQQGPVGLFEGHGDVGVVLHPGSAAPDAGGRSYSLTGSGENMWFKQDAFHFALEEGIGRPPPWRATRRSSARGSTRIARPA